MQSRAADKGGVPNNTHTWESMEAMASPAPRVRRMETGRTDSPRDVRRMETGRATDSPRDASLVSGHANDGFDMDMDGVDEEYLDEYLPPGSRVVANRTDALLDHDIPEEKIDTEEISTPAYFRLEDLRVKWFLSGTMDPRFSARAWSLFTVWLAICFVFILMFAVNLDRKDKTEPTPDVIAAARSECEPRVIDGTALLSDVSAADTKNLKGSLAASAVENAKPSQPDSFYSEETPEHVKFLLAALKSWLMAMLILETFFVPGSNAVLDGLLCESKYKKENILAIQDKYLEEENLAKLTKDDMLDLKDIGAGQGQFLLLTNPGLLIRIMETRDYYAKTHTMDEQEDEAGASRKLTCMKWIKKYGSALLFFLIKPCCGMICKKK